MRFGIIGVLIVIQAIISFGHYIVYRSVIRFTGITDPALLYWLRPAFIVLAFSFLVSTLLAFKFSGPLIRIIYSGSAIWLGTIHWLIIASVASWLLYYLAKWIVPQFSIAPVAIILLILALATSAYGVWNSYQTRVRHISVTLENLPEQWRGRKAVIIADTHLGNMRHTAFAQKISALVSEQQPDIILFAGDLYDGSIDDYAALVKPLENMRSRYGIYFAAGNHEEFSDRAKLLEPLNNIGIHVLNNESVDVDGLQIIGINYSDATTADKQTSVLDSLIIKNDRPTILIKHVPDQLELAQKAGIDFQVSGHTHTGQMWPFNYITMRVFGKFYYGLNTLDTMQVYTTSGAGTWGPPQRVATTPEIVVATFE